MKEDKVIAPKVEKPKKVKVRVIKWDEPVCVIRAKSGIYQVANTGLVNSYGEQEIDESVLKEQDRVTLADALFDAIAVTRDDVVEVLIREGFDNSVSVRDAVLALYRNGKLPYKGD